MEKMGMTTGAQIFTAAQIATALGTTPRSVRRALESIAPTGMKKIAGGNEAAAWAFVALPEPIRAEIERRASPNYRNAEHFLQDGCKPFAPVAPLTSYSPDDINKAAKLREAFAGTFKRLQTNIAANELERMGATEWRAVFSGGISERHWRRLFDKFKSRWRVEGDFERIELHLDSCDSAPTQTPRAKAQASGIIPELEAVVRAFTDPQVGTPKEIENLWERTFEYYEESVSLSEVEKDARKRVLKFLKAFAQGIAKGESGLRLQFLRKLKRYRADGSVKDRRIGGMSFKRAPEFTDKDVNAVRAYMTGTFRNQAAPAFWHCLKTGLLTSSVAEYYREKACPPKGMMKLLATKREALSDHHCGGNRTEMARPKNRRNYDNVFSNDWLVADDWTPSLYGYISDGAGWYRVIRPQVLLAIDFRSCCILGYAVIPEASYNARAIRAMFTRVADEHGLPRVGYYLENSIWRTSHILTGNPHAKSALSGPEIEQGLKEFGLQFKHAGARKPWVKPVERVFDCLQKKMFAEHGFCGLEERKDCPESFRRLKLDIEAKRKSPVGYLHSLQEDATGKSPYETQLWQWRNQFNHTKQPYSENLEGMSPMEAYQAFQKEGDPVSHFPPEVRYLFAHQKYEKTVTRENGIVIGKRRYVCEATGELQGQRVLVWFDPERDESVIVTDPARKKFGLRSGLLATTCLQSTAENVSASR